ncbi:MAG: tRNA (adenosine(37)-N6)-threonylcarbamoyltransferase complex ATPase subunit type 1 TsaE [Candidatus Omnitrophota bacterium]
MNKLARFSFLSRGRNETLKIGRKLAGYLQKGDIICLFGSLGSGKTVLAKGIASGLGIKQEEVISPTFVLLHQHIESKLPLYHFDLYRLDNLKAILDLGYEEYFYDDGVTVIEWADRLKTLMPLEYLKVELSWTAKNQRTLKFTALGRRYEELLGRVE